MTTVLEAHKLITRGLAAIADNSIFSSTLTAVSDAPKLQKEALLRKVKELKNELSSRQNKKPTVNLVELYQTFEANVDLFNEKLRKNKEGANGPHSWANLQSSHRKKEIETLQKEKAALRTDIAQCTAKPDSERLMLQQELQKENGSAALQTKNAALRKGTIQSFNNNVEPLSSEVERARKSPNNAKFRRDGTKA